MQAQQKGPLLADLQGRKLSKWLQADLVGLLDVGHRIEREPVRLLDRKARAANESGDIFVINEHNADVATASREAINRLKLQVSFEHVLDVLQPLARILRAAPASVLYLPRNSAIGSSPVTASIASAAVIRQSEMPHSGKIDT